MNREIFLIIGVVGLGLMAKGAMPLRADAPNRKESTVTMAQLPTGVAKALAQEAAGGQVENIEITPRDNQAAYEANVVINKMPYEIKFAMDGRPLEKHIDNRSRTGTLTPAPAQGTIKPVMGNGKASNIGEHFFYEIGVAVRWLSIITAVSLLFIVCKTCGVFRVKSGGPRQGGGISTIPQVPFREHR